MLATALRNPVVRHRRSAVRALAAWPRGDWPDEAEAALQAAREAEPDSDVRDSMASVLAGREVE